MQILFPNNPTNRCYYIYLQMNKWDSEIVSNFRYLTDNKSWNWIRNQSSCPQCLFFFSFIFISWRLITSQHCSGFCHIHWHESAMELHVFPIPIPPPTSLSTRFLWVFTVHQAWALVSCIPPGLVICFTIDNIHAVLLKHPTLAFSHRVQQMCLSLISIYQLIFMSQLLQPFHVAKFQCK